jgi:acyl carrier protein
MRTTAERVQVAISEQLGMNREEATPEKKLVADLGCDSLDLIEIVMAMEDEFDIDIYDQGEEVQRIVTVQDVIDYITPRVKQ